MIRLSDLAIDVRGFGEDFILTRISPDYSYLDGHRTSERIGTKYEVAIQDLGLEKIIVKVEGEQTIPDEILETKEMIKVDFEDLVGHFYILQDGIVRVTAKAKSIRARNAQKAAPPKDATRKTS